ncbi:MAG: FxsA family protein [Actinobacteria bacterium]|nr:FxsA family protein [Actinomycetota bacterium]
MFALLVVAFVVVPIAELAVIIWVGGEIGALNTIALLLAVSIAGAWLVKREGLGVIRRFRAQLDAGKIPGKELADGVLIVIAGALLLTPGFLSDILGILLLLPPVRAAVRALALRKVAVRTWRRA